MINAIVTRMPFGNPSACDQDCADDVAQYIIETFWDEQGGPIETASACLGIEDDVHYGARQLKILTRSEYQNSVEDLIGVDFDVSEGLSEDAQVELFANNTFAAIVPSTYSNQLLVAEEIAEWSAERNFSPALNCNQLDQNCANSMINDLAPRIFRRPLDTDEVAAYRAMANGSATNGDVEAGMTLALQAMLSSPQFLYRSELGEANPDNPLLDGDSYELTSYEMATFLAYTFTGSTPDAELLQAASNDLLRTDSEINRQAARLASLDSANDVMGDFVGAWLGTEDLAVAAKDENVWGNFSEVVPHMINEVRANFSNAMLDSNGTFAEIYDPSYTYLNQPLAQHYGIPGVNGNQMR